ncbi:MAG: hypothetical protein OXU81_12630 [Gammaproteobacteria bacterium]|nr:hypothetical protein [Gammaproteobacteria bacterium]
MRIERGQVQAISKTIQSAAGAGADLNSAVAVLRAEMYRALWNQGVGIVTVGRDASVPGGLRR